MKNKIHNINILIILLLSIFIIIPKDVNAEDAAKCNENFANFWCKYEVPEVKGSGAIYISDALEAPFVVDLNTGVGSDYAVHGAMTFKYHICSDGKGAVTGFAYWSGAGGFNVDAKSFIEDVNYFYDKTTKLGKCPNAFVMIQNGTALDYIKIATVLTAGTAFLLWLGDQITQKGIGNGLSLIIMAGILLTIPKMFIDTFNALIIESSTSTFIGIMGFVLFCLIYMSIIV